MKASHAGNQTNAKKDPYAGCHEDSWAKRNLASKSTRIYKGSCGSLKPQQSCQH
jgi:hypothetical protein